MVPPDWTVPWRGGGLEGHKIQLRQSKLIILRLDTKYDEFQVTDDAGSKYRRHKLHRVGLTNSLTQLLLYISANYNPYCLFFFYRKKITGKERPQRSVTKLTTFSGKGLSN